MRGWSRSCPEKGTSSASERGPSLSDRRTHAGYSACRKSLFCVREALKRRDSVLWKNSKDGEVSVEACTNVRLSGLAGFGFRVSGFGFGFRVSGFGFRVPDFGFRVSGFG